MPSNITDYTNWTYSLPQNPEQKDYKQLSSKLKSFVGSSKFLREGSTVDQYDPQTGKRIKRPIKNVIYSTSPNGSGIDAESLRDQINSALINNDYSQLQRLSKYHYYSADTLPSSIDIKQEQQQRQRLRRRRILLQAVAFGGIGSTLGLLPFINRKLKDQPVGLQDVKDSLKLTGAGIAGGLGTAGIIQLMRG